LKSGGSNGLKLGGSLTLKSSGSHRLKFCTTPLFIQLTEDFKKAKAYLYIEGETIPYGAYDCQE